MSEIEERCEICERDTCPRWRGDDSFATRTGCYQCGYARLRSAEEQGQRNHTELRRQRDAAQDLLKQSQAYAQSADARCDQLGELLVREKRDFAAYKETAEELHKASIAQYAALSAERTARRVMREALDALLTAKNPDSLEMARAALAAEPGEGPGGPAAREAWRGKVVQDAARVVRAWWPMVKPLLGKHADLLDAWDDDAERLADRLDDLAALLTLPPEGHPRAAERAATPCRGECGGPAEATGLCHATHPLRAAEVKNEG